MIHKWCPRPENTYLSLVISFFAFGVTLWGVIAIVVGLLDKQYDDLGVWITIGDIVVLLFSLAGLVFFGGVLYFFLIQCNKS